MTSRCYEELQAKLENQQLPPIFSRESITCATSENIIYYNKDSIPEKYQLQTITDWSTFDDALTNIEKKTDEAYKTALAILASDTISASIAASDAAQKLQEYHIIVASDNDATFDNFVISSDYVYSSDALAAKTAAEEAAIEYIKLTKNVLESSANAGVLLYLSNHDIHYGETVSIYIENDVLIGRIYRNVHGKFIQADFSEYYPFTINKITSYKIDEKEKTNKNNYLAGRLTKAQKWSKISKNVKIRKSKLFSSADKCSYAMPNNQNN